MGILMISPTTQLMADRRVTIAHSNDHHHQWNVLENRSISWTNRHRDVDALLWYNFNLSSFSCLLVLLQVGHAKEV